MSHSSEQSGSGEATLAEFRPEWYEQRRLVVLPHTEDGDMEMLGGLFAIVIGLVVVAALTGLVLWLK